MRSKRENRDSEAQYGLRPRPMSADTRCSCARVPPSIRSRLLTKEEAREVIQPAEEAGLIHMSRTRRRVSDSSATATAGTAEPSRRLFPWANPEFPSIQGSSPYLIPTNAVPVISV